MHWRQLSQRWEFHKLCSLELVVYPEEDCITADEYLEYQRLGNRVWILENESDWIANFQVSPAPVDCPVPSAETYIGGLAVFRPYQGRGFGKTVAEQLICRHGNKLLATRVRQGNVRSERLIGHCGFSWLSQQVRCSITWNWYFRKPLQF